MNKRQQRRDAQDAAIFEHVRTTTRLVMQFNAETKTEGEQAIINAVIAGMWLGAKGSPPKKLTDETIS